MSKCDISIRFDREDRTYTGGEPVTGRVIINVNGDTACNGITLTHQWKTHGRGNASVGPKETIPLAPAGPLVAGETLDLPFSLTSATHPLTYHGELINVDHYVLAEVNIPWAIDPKAQEEYILVAGEPPSQFTGSRNAVISLAPPPQKAGPVGYIIVCVLLLVFMIPLAMFAICLVPIGLIIVATIWLVGRAVASRLGEVQLAVPHVIVAPGENWTGRIQFRPRKQFRINGVYVTLSGKESAKSGSGTQSTTHTHSIFEHKAVIRPAQTLEADVPVDENFSLVFPSTTAYSFEATDNSIQWTAEVRIDIPRFPDWKKSLSLQVVPIEFLKKMTDAEATALNADKVPSTDLDSYSIPQVATLTERPRPSADLPLHDLEAVAGVTASPSDPPPGDLLDLATRIGAVSRHGQDRNKIVESVLGAAFDAAIIVDRVNSSMGLMTGNPGYQDGKTVIGTIQGTDQSIQVITPKSLSDEVGRLRRGDVLQVPISIDSWDSLYNRINARSLGD